ncbi:MAG: aminotransferase class I/II-fold pyridoxal phosphate-dependent enzyme [Clostridia bacterium]|nr:aminotransferase class I/II-fold pyridoxal phosphate-dependent enzyme [Clostridia bacterium]
MEFSKRMDRFEDEIFGALNEKKLQLEAEGRTIFNMSVGTPDFETPLQIREALAKAAMDPENWKYALRDLPELLDAVCAYYERRFGVTITPDMVCSCYGTQEGMGHVGLALINEGDTVLLPTPCYPVFIAGAKMAGAEPWYYPMTAETNFLPDVSTIPEEVARRAKFMVVSLPANPMGSVGDRAVYEELIVFAKQYDILLLHDNAYSDIIFDGVKGGSFLQYGGAVDVGAEFFSLSKSFDVTGARMSFLIGRPDVVAAFRKLRSQIDFGMFLPIQHAAIAALTGPTNMVERQCQDYEARRDALCGGLRSIGWNVPDSKGSMFVWAQVPSAYRDTYKNAHCSDEGLSMAFCLDLIEKAGVITTPGGSFGPLGEGYTRFALVLPPDRIADAVTAIAASGLITETDYLLSNEANKEWLLESKAQLEKGETIKK